MSWSPAIDSRFAFVLAAVLVGLLFLAFRFASAPSARSKALLALRAAALGVLVLILLNPVRVQQVKRTGPAPTAVFLLDESRSMSLETPISRAQTVDHLISRSDALLPSDRRPRVQKYGFGRDLTAVSESEKVLHPVADETRLVQALEQLPSRFGDTLPFGVFVFSDGRSTESDSPETTGAGIPSPGRADPRHAGGRRTSRGRRGRARHRCPSRSSAGHARAGSDHPAQPGLRRSAHRDLHPHGRRPQGRSVGDPSYHPR